MKAEDLVLYNKSFSELADILEKKSLPFDVSNFDTFVQEIACLSYPNYDFKSWHVRKVCTFIDEVLQTENKMAVVVLPRYHLKSTILGYFLSIYRFLTSYGDSMYVSYKEELSNFHISNIKNAISNSPIFSKIFKDLHPQSESNIEYKIENKKIRMFSAGIFATKRGLHTDCVSIVDDILGTVENPMTLTELVKAERMFNQEVINIPNKGCPLIIFGTVIDYTDILFKLKENPQFMSLWLPALYPDPEHEVLWEERYDKKWLERRKEASGWKAFSTEFLLTPVLATEAFFTRDELDKVIDKNLKNYSIYQNFDVENRCVVAGFDVGKKGNPSHISIFNVQENKNGEQELIQICQQFLDGWEYTKQVEYINQCIEHFSIQKLYYDNTRGELEERTLPRQCIPIVLSAHTGRIAKGKMELATNFSKLVEQKRIKLLDDDRFLSQILCVSNDLQAPNSPMGHGDSFISVMLAVGAYQDFFAKDRRKGFSYLGDLQEITGKDSPTSIITKQKEFDNVCKICGKRTLEKLEDGKVYCSFCFSVY